MLSLILDVGVGCIFRCATYKQNILFILSIERRNEMWARWSHKLEQKNAKRLGFHGTSDAQPKFILSLIIARPVSPSEMTLACLQIPIVQKMSFVKYIDSKPPGLRTKLVTKSKVLGFHPIDIYCNRPYECEDMTFTKDFKKFEMNKIWWCNVPSFRIDMLDFHIYDIHKVTRFIVFNEYLAFLD